MTERSPRNSRCGPSEPSEAAPANEHALFVIGKCNLGDLGAWGTLLRCCVVMLCFAMFNVVRCAAGGETVKSPPPLCEEGESELDFRPPRSLDRDGGFFFY